MSEGRHQVISVLCLTICCLMTVCGRHVPSIISSRDVPLTTFRLTRITQQPANNGHNVQLHFTGIDPDLPTVYAVNHHARHGGLIRLGKPSNGTLEFHTETGIDWMFFLHPRGYQGISIRRLDEHSPSEQFMPDMELSLQGGREVIFDSGDDAEVNYFFSVDNDSRSDMSDFSLYGGVAIKSITDDHVVNEYSDPSRFPFRDVNFSRSENDRRGHVRLMTSTGNVEGLFEVDVYIDFGCRSANVCLTEGYIIHEDVPVYQKGHDGPFPDNYVGLLKHVNRDNSNITICSIFDAHQYGCSLHCEFVGDQPSAVEFVRVAGDLNPSSQISLSNGGFRAIGSLTFGNATAPGEVEYQCRSRSGQEVSHTMKLIVVHDAKITRNLSMMVPVDNDTTEAVCVAEGTPAPTLSLSGTNFTFSSTGGDVISGPYEVVFTNPNNSTSMAVLRIHDPGLANSTRHITCRAENEIHGRLYEDRMYLNGHEYPPSVRYYLGLVVNSTEADA